MQPGICFVNSFTCCILLGHRTIMFAWRRQQEQIWHGGGVSLRNGMVHLSSYVARQIFIAGQMPLALLSAGQS